jgi:hypothetical protein
MFPSEPGQSNLSGLNQTRAAQQPATTAPPHVLDRAQVSEVQRNQHIVGQHRTEGHRAAFSVLPYRPACQSEREQGDAEASADQNPRTGDVYAQQQCDDDLKIDHQDEVGADFHNHFTGMVPVPP